MTTQKVNPKRVVLLGSSGFIGSRLATFLTKAGVQSLGFTSKQLDLCKPEAVEILKKNVQPDDVLVFISALTPDKGRDVATLMRNLTMAQHVGQFLQQANVSQFVYISSDAVYSDDCHLVRETSAADPGSLHGIMHITREKLLREFLKGKETPYLILRPCAVYGPADTHNSYGPNRFVKTAVLEKKVSITGEGEEQRDHIYIDDLCDITLRCIQHKVTGILNIATGEAISFGQAAEAVIAKFPKGEIQLIKQPRQSPATHKHFDITKLLSTFPDLKFTNFELGIARTVSRNLEQ